jgi:hypothetical protein
MTKKLGAYLAAHGAAIVLLVEHIKKTNPDFEEFARGALDTLLGIPGNWVRLTP